MVFRAVYLARHHIAQHHVVLRQPVCLAYRKRLAVFPAQHPAQEGAVHILVLLGKHGTRGTVECHSSTFFIQQGSLADGRFRTVIGHDVAGCRHPQRQVLVSERFEIRDLEHVFMRNLGLASMSGIIHHQGTISLLLPDDTGESEAISSATSLASAMWRFSLPSSPMNIRVFCQAPALAFFL